LAAGEDSQRGYGDMEELFGELRGIFLAVVLMIKTTALAV